MDLIELTLAARPLNSLGFLPCLAWLALPAWIVILVNKMIMAELDVLIGTTAILIAFYLATLAWRPPDPTTGWLAILSVYGIMIGLPILGKIADAHGDRVNEIEQMEFCYQQLDRNRNNYVMQFRMAKLMWDRGHHIHAIRIAERAIPNLPVPAFREEHKQFNMWAAQLQQKGVDLNKREGNRCFSCGKFSDAGTLYCTNCLAPVMLHVMRGGVRTPKGLIGRIVSVWAVLMVLVFAMPSIASFGPLIAIPIISVLLIGSLVALFLAFRDTMTAA